MYSKEQSDNGECEIGTGDVTNEQSKKEKQDRYIQRYRYLYIGIYP